MDPWRRNLNRLNQTRTADAHVATWGKIALALGACAAVWFLLQDHTERLDEMQTEPTVVASDAPQSEDAKSLFDQGKFAEALELALPLAESGNVAAQCMAGKILTEGRGGVAVDQIEGAKWLDLCIRDPAMDPETSDDEAREMLDRLITEAGWDVVGEGKYRAFQWQQASWNMEAGDPGSASEAVLRDLPNLSAKDAFKLGVDLNNGQTLPVDFAKALEAFKHAAEGGLTEANFNVGLAYYVGKGVKADPYEARQWLNRAVDGGFAKAAMMLAVMALRGHGMAPDKDMSLAYLDRADELGDPQARLMREAIVAGVVPK